MVCSIVNRFFLILDEEKIRRLLLSADFDLAYHIRRNREPSEDLQSPSWQISYDPPIMIHKICHVWSLFQQGLLWSSFLLSVNIQCTSVFQAVTCSFSEKWASSPRTCPTRCSRRHRAYTVTYTWCETLSCACYKFVSLIRITCLQQHLGESESATVESCWIDPAHLFESQKILSLKW